MAKKIAEAAEKNKLKQKKNERKKWWMKLLEQRKTRA